MNYKTLVFATGLLLGTLSSHLVAEDITQTITPGVESFDVLQGDTIGFPLIYSSNEQNLTGIGLSLSFDSKKLIFTGFTEKKQEGLLAADTVSKPEASNKDEDENTDVKASIAWMSVDGKWPGEAQFPVTLGVAHFKVLDTEDSVTKINITGEAAAQSSISAKSVSVTIGQGKAVEQSNTLAASNTEGGGGSMSWLFMPFLLMLALLKSTRLVRKSH